MKPDIYRAMIFALLIVACSCEMPGHSKDPWPDVTRESKPWTRWWWMGSDVNLKNINSLMDSYAMTGFGGVEITPIYGVQGREDQAIEFLSPEWKEMLLATVSAGERLDMGVDMNLGTGWPFGGPQITTEHAASRLIVQSYELFSGERLGEKVAPRDPRQARLGNSLEAVMAYSDDGKIVDLTGQIREDDILDWSPDTGHWNVYAAFCGKTRQRVKRAAPGGEGYTMDHLSESALHQYLGRFEKTLNGVTGVRSFFNDSYEVYNASWTPGFFDEFLKRRGYDLRLYLREMAGDREFEGTARLKSDYRQTMAELLLENFTRPWTEWSHTMGSMTRNQAHGSPGNLIDLYAAVDIPECEIFGHRTFNIPGMRVNTDDTRNVEPNPVMLKLATSAAHVMNKRLVSNETFTWLGEHFKVALSQCMPEVEEAFLAGINHVFYHGTTYSPEEADWPGWLFYASVHFGPTNSFWPHLPGMNHFITRCQSVLQSGSPDNEILAYWPIFDIWNNPEGLEMQLSVHNIMEWLHYPGLENMAADGYSYDFVSDAILGKAESGEEQITTAGGAVEYDALVVPACNYIPLATLKMIIDLASGGGLVVFEELPGDVPGLHQLLERREEFRRILEGLQFTNADGGIRQCNTGKGTIMVCKDIGRALEYAGIRGEEITASGLKFTRRSVDDGKCYFLVNHTDAVVDTMVPLRCDARTVLIMDPMDGSFGKAIMEEEKDRVHVRVQLLPGQSIFLRTYKSRPFEADPWVYEEARLEPVEITGSWELSFTSGGPELPAPRKLERPVPWTDLEDPDLLHFSGTAVYSLDFELPAIDAGEVILDLGKVYESAVVRLNGHDLGPVWAIPFEMKVRPYIREGMNRLEIEVAGLMANRIIYMDRQQIPWRIFHEINFVNIAYEPFDTSGWEFERSGLAGPVRLIPVETTIN